MSGMAEMVKSDAWLPANPNHAGSSSTLFPHDARLRNLTYAGKGIVLDK